MGCFCSFSSSSWIRNVHVSSGWQCSHDASGGFDISIPTGYFPWGILSSLNVLHLYILHSCDSSVAWKPHSFPAVFPWSRVGICWELIRVFLLNPHIWWWFDYLISDWWFSKNVSTADVHTRHQVVSVGGALRECRPFLTLALQEDTLNGSLISTSY